MTGTPARDEETISKSTSSLDSVHGLQVAEEQLELRHCSCSIRVSAKGLPLSQLAPELTGRAMEGHKGANLVCRGSCKALLFDHLSPHLHVEDRTVQINR